MSILSVHDIQGIAAYQNKIRIPSGHQLSFDGNLKIPVWTESTRPPSPEIGMIGFNNDDNFKVLELWNGTEWVTAGSVPDSAEVIALKQYAASGILTYKFETTAPLDAAGGVVNISKDTSVTGTVYEGTQLMRGDGASGNWNTIANSINTAQTNSQGCTLVWWARESTSPNTYQRWFDWYPTQCYWMDKQNSTTYNFGGHTVNFATVSGDSGFSFQQWKMYAVTMAVGRGPTSQSHRVDFSHNGQMYSVSGTTAEARGCGSLAGFMGYNSGNDAYAYRGWFGQVRTYKKALTSEEVSALYNDGKGRFASDI